MKVSVVIPCYNSANTIVEAIRSVQNQTYKNLELICVDNNSKDATLTVLHKCAAWYKGKFTILEESEKGAPYARNKGLKIASGEYVQFLDADDLILPGKIAHQVSLIERNNHPEIIAGSFETIKFNGDVEKTILKQQNEWFALMLGAALGITSANLFKKEALYAVGNWDNNLKSSQEYELMFRLLKNGGRALFDPEVHTQIRLSAEGISFSGKERNAYQRIKLRLAIVDYLKQSILWEDIEFRQNILQILFEKVKSIYQIDPELSINIFNKFLRGNFTPEVKYGTSAKYLLLYKLFGFKLTQRIYYK